MSKCQACTREPIGAEGHIDLFVLKMRGSQMQFRCRTCSTLWVRTTGDPSYRWHPSSEELDAPTVPGGASEAFKSR
jgi:hypothetical protein